MIGKREEKQMKGLWRERFVDQRLVRVVFAAEQVARNLMSALRVQRHIYVGGSDALRAIPNDAALEALNARV